MDSVFVDESGYTGANLLCPDQTLQVVAAVRISEERAAEIVEQHFGGVQAAELKLAKLIRRECRRESILESLRAMAEDDGAVGYVYCKRYALWLHLLNDCVEPVFYRRSIPFYDNGWNFTFASILEATASAEWGRRRVDAILRAYEHAARTKSPTSAHAVYRALREIRGREYARFFSAAMRGDLDVFKSITNPNTTLDMSVPMVVGLVSWLEPRVNGPYRLVHDHNQAIARGIDYLHGMAEIAEASQHRVTSFTTLRFPLKLADTVLADSRNDVRIQLADLFAGSLRMAGEMLRGLKPDDGFAQELLASLPQESVIFQIPSLDFADTRARFEGTNGTVIDFLAEQMAHRSARGAG